MANKSLLGTGFACAFGAFSFPLDNGVVPEIVELVVEGAKNLVKGAASFWTFSKSML